LLDLSTCQLPKDFAPIEDMLVRTAAGWVATVPGTTVSEFAGGSTTQVTVTDPTLLNSAGQRFLRVHPVVNP